MPHKNHSASPECTQGASITKIEGSFLLKIKPELTTMGFNHASARFPTEYPQRIGCKKETDGMRT